MDFLTLPVPKIIPRKLNKRVEEQGFRYGLDPLLSRILAARPLPVGARPEDMLSPKLKVLENPFKMQDMHTAAQRIANAIINKECIGLETDHDCDGQTAHAVLFYSLVKHFKHPESLIKSYIGHRLKEGYGLSQSVANRILADNPQAKLVITADNGSSDEPRIQQLKDRGIDVIVTDHHQLPVEGHPKSALACLNPTRDDCSYDDLIAGCMVAWLLMAATRIKLIEKNYLPNDAPKLYDTLDFVAVGTVADCVSMARSKMNRAVVGYGLSLISSACKPCWQVILPLLSTPPTAEDIGFKIGPLLNSDGRLACAFGSVSFLLAETVEEAAKWVEHLQQQNTERKSIQKMITREGILQAHNQVLANKYSICIFLPEGHTGVHGISASRIKDCFGRPTVFFAPKLGEDLVLSGSVRGIEGFHVRDAIQYIADNTSNIILAFGGHRGAGGVTLKKDGLAEFARLFEDFAAQYLAENFIGPVIWTDGNIDPEDINLVTIENISKLQPFGREFEDPIFQAEVIVNNIQVVGDGTHAKVELKIGTKFFRSIWFGMRHNEFAPIPIKTGERVLAAFSLKINEFRGSKKCELQLLGVNRL
jgi:single-stranded-DNA-specific exonuclease